MRKFTNSEQMLKKALEVIPLGSQTFSKSKFQFPYGASPYFIERGKGSRVWDVDGNEYIDFVNALLCVSLGYDDPDVTEGVCKQIRNGVSFTLPHRLEMEVAELLVDLIPCAEQVRFGKNGSDATSAAVRLARAVTGRDIVAVCGYHGWHDWYIGATARNLGVPKSVQELTKIFRYNDIESLREVLDKNKSKVAAVIMEPMNTTYPINGFLEQVRDITSREGALLIFDETITGCRFAKGGAQELFGVTPDLATFGKGLANGFPLSAVVGRKEVMRFMEEIFFSGTYGGETASLAAAKVVLEKVRNGDVIQRLHQTGSLIIGGVENLIKKYELDFFVSIGGHPSWSFLTLKDTAEFSSLRIKTLFLQEVFKRGVLTIGTHNVSYAHSLDDVEELIRVYDEVLPYVRQHIVNGSLSSVVKCEELVPVFKVR